MDWLKDFENKFTVSNCEDLQNLKAKYFHGSIELHFSDGVCHYVSLHRGFKPISYKEQVNSTFTEGG